MRHRVDVARVARFGTVGVAATLVHAAALGAGLSWGVPAPLANGCAFTAAVWVSYAGQRWWVFGRPPCHHARFATAALGGLAAHALGMAAFVAVGIDPWWAWACLTVLVPVGSWWAARSWVFRERLVGPRSLDESKPDGAMGAAAEEGGMERTPVGPTRHV